jgi:hypothetical protein
VKLILFHAKTQRKQRRKEIQLIVPAECIILTGEQFKNIQIATNPATTYEIFFLSFPGIFYD